MSVVLTFSLCLVHAFFSDNRALDLAAIGLSLFLLIKARQGLRSNKPNVGLVTLALASFLLVLVLDLVFFVSSVFTGKGITQQTLDHLSFDSFQAGFNGWFDYFIGLALIPLLYLVAWVWPTVSRDKLTTSKSKMLFFSAIAILIHPATYDLLKQKWRSIAYQGIDASLMSYYQEAQVTDKELSEARKSLANEHAKNVVVIYLESFERGALDQNLYPDLAPNLFRFEQQERTFGQFRQVLGTSHTIAGLVSSQCGVPYAAMGGNGNTRNTGGGNFYMPHTQCLADITAKLGYHNAYYQGGHLSFTRKGAFFSAHGYHEVKGFNEPWTDIPLKNRRGWGFHDDILFGFANQRIDELMRENTKRPFMFTLLTLDTHDAGSGKRSMSESCYKKGFSGYTKNREHQMQDQLLCSDALVGQFVDGLKQKYADDITIYLVSDHLPHGISELPSLKKLEDRELIFIEINGENEINTSRVLSHFDVGATILEQLSHGHFKRLGFGVSARSSTSTLIEKFGLNELNKKIRQSLTALAKLYWRYPSLDENPISINLSNKELSIGASSFPLPIAFNLDEDHKLISHFSGLIDHSLKMSNLSSDLLYVGECPSLATFEASSEKPQNGYCLLAGDLGADEMLIRTISDQETILFDELKSFFTLQSNPQTHLQRLYERSDSAASVGSAGSEAIKPLAEIIVSIGAQDHNRLVTNYWNQSLFEKFKGFKNHPKPQESGFILFQIKDGLVKKLHTWTDCKDVATHNLDSVMGNSNAQEFILTSGKNGLSCIDQATVIEGSILNDDMAKLTSNSSYIAHINLSTSAVRVVHEPSGKPVELRLIDAESYNKQHH